MAAKQSKYRLGLDMGTNSIGWAAVLLDDSGDPCGLLDMGVRIFPDGLDRTGESSNAATRRKARSSRRTRQRYVKRRDEFMALMVQHNLMPTDQAEQRKLETLNPYELRAKALCPEKLPAHHVGRALFHLNQHRGINLNRRTENGDKERGPAKGAAKKLHESMKADSFSTLGQFLYHRQCIGEPVRFRNQGTTEKPKYELYPTRQMILDEFNKIWKAQTPHHPDVMTDKAKEALYKAISFQIDPESPPVGKCTLDPAVDPEDKDGFRCAWAYPLAQHFRIWQEVRNLEVRLPGQASRRLSKEEGDRIAGRLLKQNTVSFNGMRQLLRLPTDAYFNLESPRREKLQGDETAHKLSKKEFFGESWRKFPLPKQTQIIDCLLGENDEDFVVQWLERHTGLKRNAAERVSSALLPQGHCRLGLRAMKKILPHMKEEGLDYAQAAKAAGYDPQVPTDELSPTGRLPYYGERLGNHLLGTGNPDDHPEKRFGRFPNPRVHVGLGQLRRIVNTLISEYGRPQQVVVEMTRELSLSQKQREAREKEQTANQKKNDARRKKLQECGLPPNHRNMLRLRLWEELNPEDALDRRCPFTGKPIPMSQLFSKQVQVEHLIPWQDSWDDSPTNKVVCFTSANQAKGKNTPYQAFHDHPDYDWDSILKRASKLPTNKRRRFEKDAGEMFARQGGFLARQLSETGWLARMSREYLTAIASDVWVTPGRLTGLIRYRLGLEDLLPIKWAGDAKQRNDHRNHAVDALVVALTDDSLLNRMSRAYDEERSKIRVPLPWQGFREEVEACLDKLIVSHKPDFGKRQSEGNTTGQLHKETAYGLIEFREDAPSKVIHRKPLADFSERDVQNVWSPELRKVLKLVWDDVELELKAAGAEQTDRGKLKKASDKRRLAARFAQRVATGGVIVGQKLQYPKRVRVKSNVRHLALIEHKDSRGVVHEKGYELKSNEFADVWWMRDDSWQMVVVPKFYANHPNFDIEDFRPKTAKGEHKGKPDPTAKRLMRLHINDMGALGKGPNPRIVRVRKITDATKDPFVVLDDHNEANVPNRVGKDMRENRYYAHNLKEECFRIVKVDAIGRVDYPEPFKP